MSEPNDDELTAAVLERFPEATKVSVKEVTIPTSNERAMRARFEFTGLKSKYWDFNVRAVTVYASDRNDLLRKIINYPG